MSVSLGMPKPAPAVLSPRRKTRQFKVGSVGVGSESPISVQSMTTTKTHDIGATLQQIAELTAAGCDIVRVACPTDKDAEALPIIAKQSRIPVIADIHFQPKYVFAAIDAGCAAVMPLAAPIGSGLGIQNKYNLIEIIENAKVPIIVDAGVGTASDAAIAMELGCDGVLMNTAIAGARNPVLMASAMRKAVEAGREAFLAGRIPRKRFASASSPVDGLVG